MINILPEAARKRATLDYRLRLISVGALSAAAALICAAALLLPAYFRASVVRNGLLTQQELADQSLAQENLAAVAKSEAASSALFSSVKTQLSYPEPSAVIGLFLSKKGSAVSVRRIEYSIDPQKNMTLRLSGVASTREELLAFKQQLSEVEGVTAASLPLDALATARDNTFAITVSYSPKK